MRNKLLLVAMLFMTFATAVFASDQYRRHRYNHFKGLSTNEQSIVFVGNSITDMGNWPEAFGNDPHIVSRGVSGGFSWEVRDNVYNWIMGHPAKVFIKIGTNDLNVAQGSPEGIAENIDKTLAICLEESPNTKVYIQSIIPCSNGSRSDEKIRRSNQLLQEVCQKYPNAEYFDLYQYMGDVRNGWPLGCADKLHLTGAGYATWAHAIEDLVDINSTYPSGTDARTMQKNFGNTGVHGGRVANFSIEPTLAGDIIVIGDGMAQSMEWHELLKGTTTVKNHATGWEVGSCDNTITANIIDATLGENGSVTRQTPKAIILYACSGSFDATTYENYITKINGYSSDIQVYCLGLQPKASNYAANNTTIAGICDKYANAHYIDIATALAPHVNDADYFTEGLPYYMSYTTIAQQIAQQAPELGLTAITTAEAQRNYTVATAAQLIYTQQAGNSIGQCPQDKIAAVKAALQTLRTANGDAIDAATTALNAAIDDLKASVIVPTSENIVGRTFQINTPNRNGYYLVSEGAGALVKGYTNASTTQYASTRWTLSVANGGGYNIQNNGDHSYLDPASLSSSDLKTVAAAPATGWTIAPADATGTFVIKTADGKFLNMRGNSEGNTICNWAQGGTSDLGNQFAFTDVTDITEVADPEPEVLEGDKYTIRVSFSSGAASLYLGSDGTNVTVSSSVPTTDAGYWYITDNAIRSAVDGKYLGVDRGLKLYTESHTLTFPAGVTDNTKCINEGGRNGAINKAGTITGGQYSNNNKYNENGGWSSDFVFELVEDAEEPAPVAYTIKLAGTNYYFNTAEVSDNANKTYSVSTTPEQFYIVAKDGGFTIQSVTSEKYAGYGHTNGWDFSNHADLWTIEHLDGTETKILQKGQSVGFGVDTPGENAGAYTNKPDAAHPNCKYMWIVAPADATTPEVDSEPTAVSIAFNKGSLSGGSGGTFKSTWTSNGTPTVTVSAYNLTNLVANMPGGQASNEGFINYTGNRNSAGQTNVTPYISTLKVSVPEDYVITGYSFQAKRYEANQGNISFQTDEGTLTISDENQSVAHTFEANDYAHEVVFTQTGDNKGILFSDFVVYVKAVEIAPEGTTYTVDKQNGLWTATNSDGSWASTWTSTDEKLTFSANANNMQWNSDNIDARSGKNKSATYTIAPAQPDNYVITGYSLKLHSLTTDTQTWNINGQNYTTSSTTDVKTINVTCPDETRSISFTNTGENNGTLLYDFTVTLKYQPAPVDDNYKVVFTTPNSGTPYRIPAVAKNRQGDLIFVADYRYSHADIGVVVGGKLDLKVRKKYADGHWGDEKTLAACITSDPFTAFGDPCIVADPLSDKIMVTSCSGNVSFPNGRQNNHQGWARFISTDGGENWSTHTDLSKQVFDQLDSRNDGPIRSFFIGSGKISQSTRIKKDKYYRLYCAALVQTNTGAKVNYAFFSDDFGENWTLLGDANDCPVPNNGDEPKVEELPDGSIIISSRSSGRMFNVFHFTNIETGEGKWGDAVNSSSHNGGCYGTGCNGEIMIVPVTRTADQQKTYLALQSVPAASDRRNVSIYYKEFNSLADYRTAAEVAPTWAKYQVSTTTSAYSTMCLDQDNDLAFFYEENSKNDGYDMVYKKISISTITSGAYSYSDINSDERIAILKAGVDPYFQDKTWAQSGTIAELVAAYKADPSDDNYCALNRALEDIVLPSPNAKECPYASAEPISGMFAQDSKVYTMYIKNQHYITSTSTTNGNYNVNATAAPTTAEGYWIIAGDLTNGYRFFNVAAGAKKVLGVTGGEDNARTALYDVEDIPANVKTRFDYAPNTYNGSKTGATFFIHGTANNALNERAPYLALWDSGQAFADHGSKIELTLVEDFELPATPADIDGNGAYEVSDVEALARIVSGAVTKENNADEYNLDAADLNSDTIHSIGDITRLIKLLLEAEEQK